MLCMFGLQNGTAPAPLDILRIEFSNPMPPRLVATKEDVDKLLIFSPPITNVSYNGR